MTVDIQRGDAPLILAFPHTGIDIPAEIEGDFISPWLARRDADWWVHRLYDFAAGLGATMVRTTISRSVIDMNRDPSGASLYPGQATTELCPTTSFDGDPLYLGRLPDAAEIDRRRQSYFNPYHDALSGEITRLRQAHDDVVVYDCHSIRSHIPRLFDGELPLFNIGTNNGLTCAPQLQEAVADICARSGRSHVLNGRFRGGWTTRHYGRPDKGVHAIQMELAIRGYAMEPATVTPDNWPPAYIPVAAAPLQVTLRQILNACLEFAQ